MSMLDAVAKLLEETGQPQHYNAITEQILAKRYWQSNGANPAATVNSGLAVDIIRREAHSRFARFAPGVYGLRAWQTTLGEGEPTIPPDTRKGEIKPIMSFTNAADYVLKEFGNSQPMHYKTITDKALEIGILQTSGQTPEATMYSQILAENARRNKRGEVLRFVQHGAGMVSLSTGVPVGLASQIRSHNDAVRRKILENLKAMPPNAFQALIATLLGAMGLEEVQNMQFSHDGGVDVRGVMIISDAIRIKLAVQVKRWNKNVQAPVVNELKGSLLPHERGMVITTSDFSKGARDSANSIFHTPIWLIKGQELVELILEYKIEHELGIHKQLIEFLEFVESQHLTGQG